MNVMLICEFHMDMARIPRTLPILNPGQHCVLYEEMGISSDFDESNIMGLFISHMNRCLYQFSHDALLDR